MTQSQVFRSTALTLGAVLALAALQGCNKSSTATGAAQREASGPPAGSDNPNGYAPTGGEAEATTAAGSPVATGGATGASGGAQNAGYYVDQPPPPIPQYDQPPPPGDGYYWTPGYWDWSDSDSDYYWVPGTWVEPPDPGLYWTPGYWAYVNGGYSYYRGYWGPTVGYYGGVNYGWGYNGRGYYGGRWDNGHYFYNSVANNLSNVHLTNVYRQDPQNWTRNRTSYSGGPGGLRVAPTPEQVSAARARHVAPTAAQRQHVGLAQRNPQLRASVNHGSPAVVATTRPGAFQGPGVVTQVKSAPHYVPPAHIEASREPPRPAGAQGRNGASPVGPAAVPGPHGAPVPAPMGRPAERAAPAAERGRSAPAEHEAARDSHPAPAARPEPAPRPEPRPAAAQRPETRPAPEPRAEARPAPPPRPEAHAAPAPRPEPHPAAPPQEHRPDPRR